MTAARAYRVTYRADGISLQLDDPPVTLELSGISLSRSRVTGTLTVSRDASIVLRDAVMLTTVKGRLKVLEALLKNGTRLDDAPFIALDQAARDRAFVARQAHTETDASHGSYEHTSVGMIWNKQTNNGLVPTLLTNFTAKITADVRRDDGAELIRTFEIQATCRDRTVTFTVAASRFTAMTWPTEHLGAEAIIFPGMHLRDHARTAIQMGSGSVPERVVYTHTGWREIEGVFAYLHAKGAIGPAGNLEGVDVDLPPVLAGFVLPPPNTPEKVRLDLRASLALLDTLAS